MANETPLSPRPAHQFADTSPSVVTAGMLRARGISAASARDRCREGGPWQSPLPGVYLLHSDRPTDQERLRAVLLYGAGDSAPDSLSAGKRAQPVVSGLAALALYGYRSVPPLSALNRIDVLVSRTRRARSTGWARVVRTQHLPVPHERGHVPLAPVARALADAVARLEEPAAVHRLLAETVGDGHCDAAEIVRELRRARLLSRPQVVDAVDSLLAEGRSLAEGRLYALVYAGRLPPACWNVELRQPGGPLLAVVDAYWPDHGVAVEIDVRAPRSERAGSALWPPYPRQPETLARLGVNVLRLTPERLREEPERLAEVLRTALTGADEREPGPCLLALPR